MRPAVRSQLWPAARISTTREAPDAPSPWLERFHAGERTALEEVYRSHVEAVHRAAAAVLAGADLETVVHEVFLRLMSSEDFRKGFRGGDLGAWLVVVARHQAIDYARRRQREQPAGLDPTQAAEGALDGFASRAEAALIVKKFCAEVLPSKWHAVFEARFLQHLTQTEAAAALRMSRTTLVYQELRIRRLLRAFLLEGEAS